MTDQNRDSDTMDAAIKLEGEIRKIRSELGGFDYAGCEKHLAERLIDGGFGGSAQAPPDQFMDDYKRDTTNAMAARILELEAALREIDNMAPATCEVTLAHQMADIASAALAPEQDK